MALKDLWRFVYASYMVNPFKLSECADGLQFTHLTVLNMNIILKYKQSTFTVAQTSLFYFIADRLNSINQRCDDFHLH
jgi:hypothetical protein